MDSAQKEGIKHAASLQLNSQVHPSPKRSSPRQTTRLEFGVRKVISLGFCLLVPCRLYDGEDERALCPKTSRSQGRDRQTHT